MKDFFKRINRRKLLLGIVWLFLLLIFLINTSHEEYPDEFDNILGGWYLLNGKLPYKGFFTHHNPLAYFLAFFILIFTRQSFVWFRVGLAVFYFLYNLMIYWLLKKRLKRIDWRFYLVYLFLLGIGATYFWGQMLLADVLSAYLIVPAFALLFLKAFYQEKLAGKDLALISILSFLTFLSSSSYLYLVALVNIAALFWYRKTTKGNWRRWLKPLIIMALPYCLFLIYLLITGSLKDYYFQAVDFNARYYIYNYPKPRGSPRINPVRYALIIANNFFNDYHGLLVQLKDFNFSYPLNAALALADTSLLIFLILKKRFKLAIFVLLAMIYSLPRSTLLFGEKDYPVSSFLLLSLFNGCFILPHLMWEARREQEYLRKISMTVLFFCMMLYGIYSTLFLFRKFNEKAFGKYMGQAPRVYDRPEIVPLIDSVIDEGDYVWLGPFEFEELFFLKKGRLPSKYQILLPEFVHSERIKKELIEEFSQNKPKIIMFRTDMNIRGYPVPEFSGFFQDFLKENYIHILSYRENDSRYQQTKSPTLVLDLEQDFYINKEEKDQILKRMVENNLLKKIKAGE